MERSLYLSVASIVISAIGIGILLFLYYDFQNDLKAYQEQSRAINSRLGELESQVVNIGILAYWNLDENAEATAEDNSGNGNTGFLENNPSWLDENQCAIGQSCLSFDGIDDYIRGPEESMRVRDQWTATSWIRLASHNSFNIVVTKMSSSNGHVNYEMKVDEQGHLVCRSHNATGDNFQTISTQSLSLGTWNSIACEYDGTRLKGWINGTQDGAIRVSGELCMQCVIGAPGPVSIGHAGPNSGCPNCDSEYFRGAIDDMRIYSRALSGSEILQLYQQKQVLS